MLPWLQNLDVELFRFVNGTLSNPLLDRLMPFVSGNVFFAPAVVLLAALVIWKGRGRGLLFAVLLGLAVGTCDGVICRIIKHAVQRPRPFSALPDVKRPGQAKPVESRRAVERKGVAPANAPTMNTNSMPSAHAANWFAATMVALIYYRKSVRFMLPVACLVSFSRVYNGVHYPSDVLAGAIIGAGHAAALLWLLDSVWQWAGPKWFEKSWQAMPSLLRAPLCKRTSANSEPAISRHLPNR